MKLEKSYNTKQYFHSFYRQNHALLVLSFLFTVICFPANLIGSWLLGQVIDAITEVSMNRLRTIILVSIIFIVTMFFFTILLYWVKSNFIRKALIQYKNLAFEKISEKNIAAFSRENTGSYISMLTNDAASIEENYLRKSFLILHYVLLFFGTLIMMLRYSIVLTFATIVLGFLPAIASILMGKELSSREKIVSDKNETFVTQLKNLLAGFSVIKSFQAEKETQELFNTTNNDTYYLVGFHDYRQQVAKFRVDRIVQMEVTDETAVKKPKGFDVSEFFTQEFSMLNGKTCRITLLCESTLMNSIIDRFGEDASTQIVDKNHFTVEATVDLSSNFYGWVFASGGKMKITAPQEAVDGFQRMLESFSER